MTTVLDQMHMYGWNGWWMALWMLVFWAFVVGGVVALVRLGTRPHDVTKRARDVLAERYASGEIDTDEFHARSRELEKAGR